VKENSRWVVVTIDFCSSERSWQSKMGNSWLKVKNRAFAATLHCERLRVDEDLAAIASGALCTSDRGTGGLFENVRCKLSPGQVPSGK